MERLMLFVFLCLFTICACRTLHEMREERHKVRESIANLTSKEREESLVEMVAYNNLELKNAQQEAKDYFNRTVQAEQQKKLVEDELRKIKDPVLVRCEIEWFENMFALDFELKNDQAKYDRLKKHPRQQRIFLSTRRWVYILTRVDRKRNAEIDALLNRIADYNNNSTTVLTTEVFATGVAVLREIISDAVIHAIQLGREPRNVTILNKQPYEQCANILINIGPALPVCSFTDNIDNATWSLAKQNLEPRLENARKEADDEVSAVNPMKVNNRVLLTL